MREEIAGAGDFELLFAISLTNCMRLKTDRINSIQFNLLMRMLYKTKNKLEGY